MIAACSSETGRTLIHADSVMEEHPDSALSILEGIDRNSLNSSDLPYYALLYTQAQVKNDIPLASDSLISMAYAKYGADTRGDRGIRSNFYTGEVFFNQENYREAMRYYLTAYEESKRLSDDYWRAKAAERISDLFFYAYNYDEAQKYAEEAAGLFRNVGRDLYHRYSLAQLARILINNGDYERGYTLLDSLHSLAIKQHPIDSAFIDYLRLPLIEAALSTGRSLNGVSGGVDLHSDNMSDGELLDAIILQSSLPDIIGNPDQVELVLDEAASLAHSEEDKIHLLYARYENAKKAGDLARIINMVDSMLYYQNAVAEDIIQESVKGAQRDFYSEQSILHEQRSKTFKWLLFGACLFSVLLISAGVIFHVLKNKAQKAKFQANLEALLSLKAQSEHILRERDSLKLLVDEFGQRNETMVSQIEALKSSKRQMEMDNGEIVEKLFKEKWTALDALCDQYYGLNNSELTATSLVGNLQKEVKKIVSKKGLVDVVAAVDTYMNGIVTRLRTQCPFLKEEDVNFVALLFAGFSVRAVCMFTGIKYDYFYVKRGRLKTRIQSSDAPDKALFLQKLR